MIVHCKLPSNVLARPETRAYVQELNKGAAPPSQKTIREIGAAIRLAPVSYTHLTLPTILLV